ncbi:MAG: beta-glucosidase BglX [Pyrinomonadaceae bacterium]|nr:beta-glucosidase BglX [Pyrinomonadaceae bacterium]
MKYLLISLIIMLMLLPTTLVAQESSVAAYKNAKLPIDQRVSDLLRRMTLEEKVGQLNQLSGGVLTGPAAAGDAGQQAKLNLVRQGKMGSFLNVLGAKETGNVQKIAVEESRMGIPLLFAYDVIHGYKTVFPIPIAEASSWNPAGAERAASIAAKEAASAGLHWTFAPMMDVTREPRWGRVMEGSGEDPYLGGVFAAARVRGFQGTEFTNEKIMACVKHFAAYGAPEGGREYNTVDISRYALWNYYLPPYKAAVEAGSATVMNAFNIVDAVPASGNHYLNRTVLRDKWGFKGFIVSDWGSFGEMIAHGYAADDADAAKKALMAGSDMDMESRVMQKEMADLVRNGKVPARVLDEAVGRILYWKFKLGLFEDPYKYSNEAREKATLLTDEHRRLAREAAAESMILLKNDGGILPISKTVKNVLVTGYLAESQEDVLDFWKGHGDHKDTITILEGIKKKLPGAKVSYSKGYNSKVYDDSFYAFNNIKKTDEKRPSSAQLVSDLRAKAASADVIIATIGLTGRVAGEARSLADINPDPEQMAMLKALKATGKPLVVVVQAGRPLILTDIDKNYPAILNAWIGGTEHGNAVADILFGDVNPSAKTTISFPYALGQIPIYYNRYNTGRPHKDGQEGPDRFWVARYRDIPNEPLYPFGYGLSYSNFEYSGMKLSKNTMNQNEKVVVSVTVKNSSKRAGREIVQLYIRDLVASRVRPLKELKDFKKVEIKAGESKTVTFDLPAEKLGFYDEEGNWLLETGAYKVFVGPNSRDVQEVGLTLE